jgi:hypothetical protein
MIKANENKFKRLPIGPVGFYIDLPKGRKRKKTFFFFFFRGPPESRVVSGPSGRLGL